MGGEYHRENRVASDFSHSHLEAIRRGHSRHGAGSRGLFLLGVRRSAGPGAAWNYEFYCVGHKSGHDKQDTKEQPVHSQNLLVFSVDR
ncbi:MAG: hypothetical protein DMG33_09555 [Acidobacteria bacterium]|nr:MAG: hypothetical protein DMG33_09555 [Acidobacteriota bacterium]